MLEWKIESKFPTHHRELAMRLTLIAMLVATFVVAALVVPTASADTKSSTTAWTSQLWVQDTGSGALGCFSRARFEFQKCSTPKTLSDNDFEIGGNVYSFYEVTVYQGSLNVRFDMPISNALKAYSIHVDGDEFAFGDAILNSRTPSHAIWGQSGLDWSRGDYVDLKLMLSPVVATPTRVPMIVSTKETSRNGGGTASNSSRGGSYRVPTPTPTPTVASKPSETVGESAPADNGNGDKHEPVAPQPAEQPEGSDPVQEDAPGAPPSDASGSNNQGIVEIPTPTPVPERSEEQETQAQHGGDHNPPPRPGWDSVTGVGNGEFSNISTEEREKANKDNCDAECERIRTKAKNFAKKYSDCRDEARRTKSMKPDWRCAMEASQ